MLGNDIHRYVQQRLKIEQQSAEIEQRTSRFHLDEEIDVAFFVVVAPRDRTENTHVPGAAMRGRPQDFFPPPVAKFLKSHSPSESNRSKDGAEWSMQQGNCLLFCAAHGRIVFHVGTEAEPEVPGWQLRVSSVPLAEVRLEGLLGSFSR